MDRLVQASLFFRRLARRVHGLFATCALAAWVVLGGGTSPLGPTLVLGTGLWAFLLVTRLRRRLSKTAIGGAGPRRTAGDGYDFVLDVELGALLAVGLDAALVRFEGDLSGPFSPAVYVLVALVASFARPAAGLVVVAWVVVLEALVRRVTLGEERYDLLLTHAAFVAAFALLNLAFLRAEVARIRATARGRVEAELTRLKDDARRYRLLGAGDDAIAEETSRDRLERSSVEEIHQSVHYALDLLRRSLDLHTAVLLWLNDAGTHLRISELSTASDDIHDAPFSSGDGVLGAVFTKHERVVLENLRPSFKVPYYGGPCPIRTLAAIPVNEDGALRGILAIDRTENKPFTPHEQELAAQAARYCLRAIQNERVFVQLERAKVEQGKLYRAARALGQAIGEKDVIGAGVRSAREIAKIDLAAITVYDPEKKNHEVVAAKSEQGDVEDLVGARFNHNTGLVSLVVQNRFPLP
jgi:hypothetical protein